MFIIMTSPMFDLSKLKYDDNFKVYFTYDDIKSFTEYPEGPLVELYDGDLFVTPSPSTKHQKISFNLTLLIGNIVEANDLGTFLTAPIDVIFSSKNVFVPDLLYISNDNSYMVSEENISGSPDFIIEILSSNKSNDLVKKKEIYEKYLVKEYWIVDPVDEIIIKYVLQNDKFTLFGKFDKTNKYIKVESIDTEIEIEKIFKI